MEEQSIAAFMAQVIQNLEKYMNLPKESIVFCHEEDLINGGNIYRCRQVRDQPYVIGFRDFAPGEQSENRFLLDTVAEEMWLTFQDSEEYNRDGGAGEWFYDYAGHMWHTPKTLAEALHERVSQKVFTWMRGSLGIDPLVVSDLCGMTYEKDRASGCLAFWTGQLDKGIVAFRLYSSEPAEFIKENLGFVRKQLAGAKKGGLLFVRAGADHHEEYVHTGYLAAVEKAFVTIWLEDRGYWVLRIGGRPIFKVKSRDVFGLSDPLVKVRREIDAELGDGTAKKLAPILKALQAQGHGTSVIFLDMTDPVSSAMFENLEKMGRALKAENIRMDDIDEAGREHLIRLLRDISRVDGSLVWDYRTQSLVYANVIVDGRAILPGRREFGARRNAVAGGIANLASQDSSGKIKAIAVIFSEDGGISTVSASECRKELKKIHQKRDQGTLSAE